MSRAQRLRAASAAALVALALGVAACGDDSGGGNGPSGDNAGDNGDVVANEVLRNKDANYGYDARAGEYTDMVKKGVIDPTKVVRSALQNAASVSTLLLTSDALVADAPKKEDKKPAGGGGYEDMY